MQIRTETGQKYLHENNTFISNFCAFSNLPAFELKKVLLIRQIN